MQGSLRMPGSHHCYFCKPLQFEAEALPVYRSFILVSIIIMLIRYKNVEKQSWNSRATIKDLKI